MEKNIGEVDKAVRMIVGVVILAAGAYMRNWFGIIGLVPLFTAVQGRCPLYSVLGMNTCGKK
ncbi:MAG: DUF2892 domain-containing protein, partial [Candidatus Omnitrophica bacterium]|nr:DUF2892 domain-containing protein [Candidatus Omnitrophota bacterium]